MKQGYYKDCYGHKRWYQDGLLHRDNDRPAVIYHDADRYWYQYGKIHRVGNPAVVYEDGYTLFYLNDVRYSEEEYWEALRGTLIINNSVKM